VGGVARRSLGRASARGRLASARSSAGTPTATRGSAAPSAGRPARSAPAPAGSRPSEPASAARPAGATETTAAALATRWRLWYPAERRERPGGSLSLEPDPNGVVAGGLTSHLVPAVAQQGPDPGLGRLPELVLPRVLGPVGLEEDLSSRHVVTGTCRSRSGRPL
jgi:hypothetical protein